MTPADVSPEFERELSEKSLAVYRFLGCRGMARVDWRCDGAGIPNFLEINTIPGMTSVSLLPKAAKHAGISEKGLVGELVRLAREVG